MMGDLAWLETLAAALRTVRMGLDLSEAASAELTRCQRATDEKLEALVLQTRTR